MADRHLNALPEGYELQGYRVEHELGAGGFGITYRATELLIGRSVAIKEYMPPAVALRGHDTASVHPIGPRSRAAFDWGLQRFRKEARALVNFRHPNIVSVYRYFEAKLQSRLGEAMAKQVLRDNVIRAFRRADKVT